MSSSSCTPELNSSRTEGFIFAPSKDFRAVEIDSKSKSSRFKKLSSFTTEEEGRIV